MLTKELVDEFNEELKIMGCAFRCKFFDDNSIPRMDIVPISMKYIDSYIFNLSEEFRLWMFDWFKQRGKQLHGNNTGCIYWAYTEK